MNYIETLTKIKFEEACGTKLTIVPMKENDKYTLGFFLQDSFEGEEEVIEEFSEADGFAITEWDSGGWSNSINPSPSYGVFLVKGDLILGSDDVIWEITSEVELKKALKQMERGEFIK